MITMIAAIAENNGLGKDNMLLWHLPDDFKHFKSQTSNHYIVMGRKTFESFPKPLPNRTHIILTNQKSYKVPKDVIVVHNVEDALKIFPVEEEVFIIGGGEIYHQFLTYSDKIILTHVDAIFAADAFFPNLSPSEWELTEQTFHPKDEKHQFSFTYKTYKRM
jgi:dihydrofolate reductase